MKLFIVSIVKRGNFTASGGFSACQTNLTGKQRKLFARARELANSDLLIEVIDRGNCNSVERLARSWNSLLLPEVQGLISTSQGTKGWTRTETSP